MNRLLWWGRPPEPGLRAALAAEGIALTTGAAGHHGADAGAVVVVATPTRAAAPPAPPAGASWIWAARGPVAPEAMAAAVDAGAYDVIDVDAPDAAKRLAARVRELDAPEPPIPATTQVVSQSATARAVLRQLARAARTSMPVLLTGETGTGKEVAARLVHEWSERRARRFVPINCAAIPNELLEAELFGYAKGAFTGSVRAYEGQLTAAEGGTVLLDEVDDTPLPFQVKLLRVLEDRVVTRVGENTSRLVDFRILAATNRDLGPMCDAGLFGADLYERLAIVSVRLPPLRERLDDLPALARHMIGRFYAEEPTAKARHAVESISDGAMAALRGYPWPGNIRELRNVVFEALVDKRAGNELLLADLPRRVRRPPTRGPAPSGGAGLEVLDAAALHRALDEGRFDLQRARESLERTALEAALARAGNASAAAALLGRVGRGAAADPGGTVRAMMRRLGVAGPEAAAPSRPVSSTSREKPAPRRSRRRSR